MKKKQNQNQTQSQKDQKKKTINSRRKKVNDQKRKIKKRSKAAKIVKSKKHNRRFSDKAPLILSPVIPEIATIEERPIILPPKLDSEETETLLTHTTLLSMIKRNILISANEQEFEQNMNIIEEALDKIEKDQIISEKRVEELVKIKIGRQ